MKFIKNKKYYTGDVYEWNLPTGTTCPFALECKVSVDRTTGKFSLHKGAYKCYAASPERFPAVREHRWRNFEHVRGGQKPVLPKDARHVRVHSAGDFFNQDYFDLWVEMAIENPNVKFWAFTKSVQYWVNRLNVIPPNFTLTASYGGSQDKLIEAHNLKHCKVYKRPEDVPFGMPVDRNDDCARTPQINFALLDNKFNSKKVKPK